MTAREGPLDPVRDFEADDAFLFAVLGAVAIGEAIHGTANAAAASGDAALTGPSRDPVLDAVLGAIAIAGTIVDAARSCASASPAPQREGVAPASAPADLLR